MRRESIAVGPEQKSWAHTHSHTHTQDDCYTLAANAYLRVMTTKVPPKTKEKKPPNETPTGVVSPPIKITKCIVMGNTYI